MNDNITLNCFAAKKILSKHLLWILILFLSPEVFAAGLFEVLPTDKSQAYLGMIFGGSVGLVTLGGDVNPMLSKMFERFNFIIVTVGVSILSYIGIAAAINTAREGEALGKKFSLWVILRALLGMLLMIPTPGTGYSVVQMTVIWVVLNGIGAANNIWNVVLDQLASGIKATGKIEVPISNETLNPLVKEVMKASTCMQVINHIPNLKLTQDYGRVKLNTSYDPIQVTYSGTRVNKISQTAFVSVGVEGSPNAADARLCGRFRISTEIIMGDRNNTLNASSLATRLAIKVNALIAMFAAVEPATTELRFPPATEDAGSPPEPQPGYVNQAINAYKAQIVNLGGGIRGAVGNPMSALSSIGGAIGAISSAPGYIAQAWEQTNNTVPIGAEQVAIFKRLGWIHAGSYYYALSKSSVGIDQDALAPATPDIVIAPTNVPDVQLSNPNTVDLPTIWPANLFANLAVAANRIVMNKAIQRAIGFADTDTAPTPNSLPALGSGKVSSGNGFVDRVLGGISDKIRSPIIEMFQRSFIGQNEDPLISIGRFGWQLMLSGEIGIFAAMVTAFLISMAVSPASCMNPAAYAGNQLLIQVFVVVFTFLGLMWTLGASLGVYLPLIPYIVFTGTAVGWLFAVIEAVVAAPLIALAMVKPGEEELAALKTPLLILANLFLRPSLMIFGFVIAASFLRAILTMIGFGFTRAVEESVIPTLFGIIPILGIFTGLIIAMTNQAFQLIPDLPNKAMRYMGHADKGQEPVGTGEAKSGFESGSKVGAGMQKAAGGAGTSYLKGKMADAKEKFDAAEEKKKRDAEAQAKNARERPEGGRGGVPGGGFAEGDASGASDVALGPQNPLFGAGAGAAAGAAGGEGGAGAGAGAGGTGAGAGAGAGAPDTGTTPATGGTPAPGSSEPPPPPPPDDTTTRPDASTLWGESSEIPPPPPEDEEPPPPPPE